MKRTVASLIFCVLGGLGCGDAEETIVPAPRLLVGKLGSGFSAGTLASRVSSGRLMTEATTSADKVVAVPLVDGEFGQSSVGLIQEAEIASDGSFELELGSDYDWVAMLVDSSLDREKSVVGFISFSDDSNTMVKMPMTEGTDDVDLGSVASSGDGEAVSEHSVDDASSAFEVSTEVLQEIAKTDDVLRNAKNLYVNYNSDNGEYYGTQATHGFKDAPGNILDRYSDPLDFDWEGYIVTIETNHTSPSVTEICNKTTIVGLTAPLDSNGAQQTFDTKWQSNLTSTTTQSPTLTLANMNGEENCSDQQYMGFTSRGTSMTYTFGSDLSIQNILEGLWKITAGSSTLAYLDLKVSSPVDEANHPVAYVPSIKTTTASGVITQIDIKWYTWDRTTSVYTEVSDLATLRSTVQDLYLSLSDYNGVTGGSSRVDEQFDDFGTSITSFTETWKAMGDSSTTSPVPSAIGISYSVGGIGYVFEWEN